MRQDHPILRKTIRQKPFALASDDKQTTALLSAVYQEVQREYPTESDLKSVRTLITYIKNMMLTDEELAQLGAELAEEINIAEIYQRYCRAMRENQWMDYDDQMIYAYRMLCKYPQIYGIFSKDIVIFAWMKRRIPQKFST